MHPLDRINRIESALAAERPLAPEDGAALLQAIRRAKRGECSIEAGLGLAANWVARLMIDERRSALQEMGATIAPRRKSELAKRLSAELERYKKGAYPADCAAGCASNQRHELHFRFLNSNRGKVPTYQTLRAWLPTN